MSKASVDEMVDLVLGSPLGREFVAKLIHPMFTVAVSDALGLGEVPGTARLTFRFGGADDPPPTPRRHANWTEVETHEAEEAVQAVIAQGRGLDLTDIDQLDLLMELAPVTSSFGFSPGDESLWGLTALATEAMRPVAKALVGSPGAAHWWDPVQRADQRLLQWDGQPAPIGDQVQHEITLATVREHEREERARERPPLRALPGVLVAATWWSSPDFAPMTWTTPAIEDIPSIVLGHFIDTHTPFDQTGATIWTMEISPEARVYEVSTPDDWRALVERYPRDVTATHSGEWPAWSGVDGAWILPDWEWVMDDYDGVHVTPGGYISSCGLALPVGGGYTMLAGWVPDATLWLRDVAIDRRVLGRWEGNPQRLGSWDRVRGGWKPG